MDVVSIVSLILAAAAVALIIPVAIMLLRIAKGSSIDSVAVENAVTKSISGNTELIKTLVSAAIASSQETLKGSMALALKDLKVDQTMGRLDHISEQMSTSTGTLLKVLETGQARGSFGETQMERLLRDSMASSYIHMRESVKGLGTPDAYVESPYGIVCIDSKFPLANYRKFVESEDAAARTRAANDFRRDVRAHLDKVAGYVRPDLKTARIALAFIPSESVYAYLAEFESRMLEDVSKAGVVVSSPSTLLANLTLITAANRALEVAQRAHDIQMQLSALEGHIAGSYSNWRIVYKHVYDAYSKLGDVEHSFDALKLEFEKTSSPSDGGTSGQS